MIWVARWWIRRIAVWRWVIWLPLSMVDRWADLPLPALLFNGYLRINPPVETLSFLVTLDESIMLAKVVTYT